MNGNTQWLDATDIFRVGKLPPHSDHSCFLNSQEALNGCSSLTLSLNGTWQFCYSKNPHLRPADFYREDFDSRDFQTISVPGHIELAGYDHVHYMNKMYPWESRHYRRPADVLPEKPYGCGSFVDTDYNPVGSYRKIFDLPSHMAGHRIILRFDGVEQAMFVWLNGHFIGYSEDSYTPAEFDLTPFIRSQHNILCVEVYKWSTASFVEDQDYFRFFGIFRNVCVTALPVAHIEDMDLRPTLNRDLTSGSLLVKLKASGSFWKCMVKVTLHDPDCQTVAEKTCSLEAETILTFQELRGVKPWNHFSPALYKLSAEIIHQDGTTIEYVTSSIGFRRIEISGKTVLLNKKRLQICGVNRHEWNEATGRCISKEDMLRDIEIFKRNHINAVRTCHYPNQAEWYTLCDQNGIYVMAETNLESHGSWQKLGKTEPSWNVPGCSSVWEKVILDRASNHYELLKNHPSVLFWSLGNEAYAGTALVSMNRYYKEKKDGRLTHYEGVTRNRIYEADISDLESRMYASPASAARYLSENPVKPFILCEYLHSMGNSTGGLKEYMDLFHFSEAFVGGFIWDYIDKALLVTDNLSGQKCLRYGGDFDDRPSDYAYSADGLVFADRTEKPAMQEVSYFYALYET